MAFDSAICSATAGVRRHALILVLLVFATLARTAVAAPAESQPLFAADTPLAATLSIPLDTLLKDDGNEAVSGTLTVGDTTLDVEVTKRGHSRLDYCDMPPLKLDFRREQVEGTLFSGQNKLKLVNQCQQGSKYARYLHQEYGIYRAYLALTEAAFRVRMLDLTFVDTDGWMRDRTRPAFLIEADGPLAARLGSEELEVPEIPVATVEVAALVRFGLFQYLIGNTDWSVKEGRGDDPCCHNGLLLESADGSRTVVPYDFDQAGLISTEYAVPARGLPIRRVRDRLYRGMCVDDEQLAASVQLFNERRADIEAAFPVEGAMRHGNKRAQGYIDDFYQVINDPQALQEEIVASCRGAAVR